MKNVHRKIRFNQNASLKPSIGINTDLRKKAEKILKNIFFNLMNNAAFRKTMENMRKYRYQTCHNRKKKKLFGVRTKLSYYKIFYRKFISNRNDETEILMNESVCLGLSILELSKILMYEFWYDYVKPKYGEKAKLYYIDTFSLYT